jgi:small subunit ribosomal protein S11
MNMDALTELFSNNKSIRSDKNGNYDDMGKITNGMAEERLEDPHHFHIYATKHNTHITLTKPNRDPLISVSCGNIGFRKAGRKHYDSAFQLAAYVIGRIQEQGLNPQIKKLEVTLRGFGAGREAVTKALLGTEGRLLRGKIVKVSDATRLKFGGTRSKKPRRLG